jgi:hypothetical protein
MYSKPANSNECIIQFFQRWLQVLAEQDHILLHNLDDNVKFALMLTKSLLTLHGLTQLEPRTLNRLVSTYTRAEKEDLSHIGKI